MAYDGEANIAFDCPGHQGGQFYRKSPPGQLFFKYFGESIFRNDLCNADVDLGDLLIHEGPAAEAQKNAAPDFRRGQDLLHPERHEHLQQGGDKCGAASRRPRPVRPQQPQIAPSRSARAGRRDPDLPAYLAQSVRHDRRRGLGGLGRGNSAQADRGASAGRRTERPKRIGRSGSPASSSRPTTGRSTTSERCWRKSVISASTCCGTRHGSATTPSIPLFENHSPMRLKDLGPDMPGLFSTQSVHKQGAGFSQASQIHKRDEHIRGQHRYLEHKRFNESFLMNVSTSPFYPLFASLDVNAKIQRAKRERCSGTAASSSASKPARSFASSAATMRRPGKDAEEKWFFDPVRSRRGHDPRSQVHRGRHRRAPGRVCPTEVIKSEQQCWNFEPESTLARLFGLFRRLRDGRSEQADAADARHRPQDRASTSTSAFPPPSSRTICASSGSLPEKCDLNSILFLMTPAEDESKLNTLIAKLVKFKNLWDRDAPLAEVLPTVCAAHRERYAGYTLRQICNEMHDFYRKAKSRNCSAFASERRASPSSRCRRSRPTRRWSPTRWTTCRWRSARAASRPPSH